MNKKNDVVREIKEWIGIILTIFIPAFIIILAIWVTFLTYNFSKEISRYTLLVPLAMFWENFLMDGIMYTILTVCFSFCKRLNAPNIYKKLTKIKSKLNIALIIIGVAVFLISFGTSSGVIVVASIVIGGINGVFSGLIASFKEKEIEGRTLY